MEFLNEHSIYGNLGHFFVLLSLVSSFVAMVAFYFSSNAIQIEEEKKWQKFGTLYFKIQSAAVFLVFGTLFFLIFNHYYEYHYVWAHSNNALDFKYLLSCFWEGQEGSFLLWLIWHAILGLLFLRKKTEWTAPVMTVVSLAQFFLSITLLGLYFGDIQIGSSPFSLLRNEMQNAPIFQQANYLDFVKDGNGLNPLLQNYWMVIHPPILFLGFASTLFPFAFVIAALWKKRYENLTTPLIRWGLFASMILGTGIIMGGAWAYESLNFGGYWAWDPVENSSLVPWLIMIAALHTTIIYKARAYALRSTILFFILSFCLVLYSTFLTRTGILGDTSVHAFTGEGDYLGPYLLFVLSVFFIGALVLFFIRYKNIPDVREEEALSSREFWMYIGALIFIISSVQITNSTSLPVWNKLFGTDWAITEPMQHYNGIQIWLAILIALGMGLVYFLKFNKTDVKNFIKTIWPFLLISIIFSSLLIYFQEIKSWPVNILVFAAWICIIGNIYYLFKYASRNLKKWGGNIAHVGFGLMLVGIIISSYNKNVISINRLGVDFDLGKGTMAENRKESRENVMLFRGIPVSIGKYSVRYLGDSVVEPYHYYKVEYTYRQNDTGKVLEQFVLKPNAHINPKMGLSANPDTKHYLTKDVFTYITNTIDKSKIKDTTAFTSKEVKKGDSIFFANGYMIFNKFEQNISNTNYQAQNGDIAVSAVLDVYNLNNEKASAKPIYYIRSGKEYNIIDTLDKYSLYVSLDKIIPEHESAIISFKQPNALNDYIIMKAIEFPYINVLWLGTFIMIIGFLISMWKRFS